MDGKRVEVTRTVVMRDDFARAVVSVWPKIFGAQEATDEATSALWSQYLVETGGSNCWNWNIGNVKKWNGDGFDWMCLNGVWEGFPPAVAKKYLDAGVARLSTRPDQIKAVGANKTCIVFMPPHPMTMFRAYPSLERAVFEHVIVLAFGRHEKCWKYVLAGDVVGVANALSDSGYYTASRAVYSRNMVTSYGPFLSSDAFEKAMAERLEALPKVQKPIDFQAYDRSTRPIVDDEDPSEPDPHA